MRNHSGFVWRETFSHLVNGRDLDIPRLSTRRASTFIYSCLGWDVRLFMVPFCGGSTFPLLPSSSSPFSSFVLAVKQFSRRGKCLMGLYSVFTRDTASVSNIVLPIRYFNLSFLFFFFFLLENFLIEE